MLAPAWVLLECGQRQFHTDDINLPLTLHLDLWRKAEKKIRSRNLSHMYRQQKKKKKNQVAVSACNGKVKTPNAVKVGGQC